MVYTPVGVDKVVFMVNLLLKDEVPKSGLKAQETPVGSPVLHERVTGREDPPSIAAVIVFDPEPPCIILVPPEVVIEGTKFANIVTFVDPGVDIPDPDNPSRVLWLMVKLFTPPA